MEPREAIRSFKSCLVKDLLKYEADETPKGQAAARLLERFDKRFAVDDPMLESRALENFIICNDRAKDTRVNLDPEVANNAALFIRVALEKYTAEYVSSPQCCLDVTLFTQLWRLGPGSSVGTRRTHFADKIRVKKWSVTESASRLLQLMRTMNPHLKLFDELNNGFKPLIVEGSSMSTVPKNATVNRTICTEPLGNMALQLAAGAYIEGSLRRVGLDIATQEAKNKTLAYYGSISGKLSTIDLSNASDLITIELVKTLWPREWFLLFMMARSPVTTVKGKRTELHMMSTMGNGFTFPMMTLTLLALVYANRCTLGKQRSFSLPLLKAINAPVDVDALATPSRTYYSGGEVGVYGDDIIVPTDEYQSLCEVLTSAGLMVNHLKSYSTGSFRESCGGDYFQGHCITPFYVKSLSTEPDIYIAVNQLTQWCSRTKIPLHHTLDFFISMIEKKPFVVPEWMPEYSGIHSSGCPRRFNYLELGREPTVRRALHPLDVLSIVGGYVGSAGHGDRIVYHRRRNSPPVFTVENGFIPKGIGQGYDPLKGSYQDSRWRDLFLSTAI